MYRLCQRLVTSRRRERQCDVHITLLERNEKGIQLYTLSLGTPRSSRSGDPTLLAWSQTVCFLSQPSPSSHLIRPSQ